MRELYRYYATNERITISDEKFGGENKSKATAFQSGLKKMSNTEQN